MKNLEQSILKISTRRIGNRKALEDYMNPDLLVLQGKKGHIEMDAVDNSTLAVIYNQSHKLRLPDFSDLVSGEQNVPVSSSGLLGMIKYLEIPEETDRQLRLHRDILHQYKKALK